MTEQKFIIGALNHIQFPEDNEMLFFMDHGGWRNIPSDIKFYPTHEYNSGINFIGDGYGILPKYNIPGRYGSGSIFLFINSLPDDIVKWCRENFLK